MSWGFHCEDIIAIREALQEAHEQGILILASASNSGANDPITFPANLPMVLCISAADGKGNRSDFSSYKFGVEKYMALGVAVNGATVPFKNCLDARRSGSSTATPIAAGIAALLIDYTRRYFHDHDARNSDNMRKLFLAMSKETDGNPNRYLAPWSLFDHQDHRETIKRILEGPLGNQTG